MEACSEAPYVNAEEQQADGSRINKPRSALAVALVGAGAMMGLCALFANTGSVVPVDHLPAAQAGLLTLAEDGHQQDEHKEPEKEEDEHEEPEKEEDEHKEPEKEEDEHKEPEKEEDEHKEPEKEEDEHKEPEKEEEEEKPPPMPPLPRKGSRLFLHVADTHADPFYDYTQYGVPAPKISRSPKLFSNKQPAEECGWDTAEDILAHWNRTGGGERCPCGQFGANPPFSVLASLRKKMDELSPEFVVWSGDFASHYLPGTNVNDKCRTAKEAAKASVMMLNAKGNGEKPIQHLWGWGNNDVLPKRQPLTQEWLEEFGQHLLKEGWLQEDEMSSWNKGGFYRRHLGNGLCVIVLNSNSWTVNQINEQHHRNQVQWFELEAFDEPCRQYILNAHVPLGWVEGGEGHHTWSNLEGVEITDHSDEYRRVIEENSASIIGELYGHINKADIRLMSGDRKDVSDAPDDDVLGDIDENIGDTDDDGEKGDDVDTNSKDEEVKEGNDKGVVSFTVAGISRRGNNDPQFQKILLENLGNVRRADYAIADISVEAMRTGCDFEDAYSFRDLFNPHFDKVIDEDTLRAMVHDKAQVERVESHLAMTCAPYNKKNLVDPAWLEEVRAGKTGCECVEKEKEKK